MGKIKLSGLLGGTAKLVGFLLFGSDDTKKQQILNYAKATMPKVEDLAIKAIEAGAEGLAKGAVEEAKNGQR